MHKNGHDNGRDMILKIDTEGAEWDFLRQVDSATLQQFDQIIFEFHNLIAGQTYEQMADKIAAFAKMNKTHGLVHLHGTNMDMQVIVDGNVWPNALEATYVNRQNYVLTSGDNIILPNALDRPSDENREEIILGKWNLRN